MNALLLPARLRWLSLAALAVGFALYFATDFSLGGSSPLALLLAIGSGWLLRIKEPIGGNLLVGFGGAALLVFPFLYEAPYWYSLLALPMAVDGGQGLWHWWNEG
ncbi:hypothetical protein SAMN05444008_106139 [Cnuella takakiae]|uniref:Uncharacterized protein n=1 Tax=Cnuella takakiae TaxID=1302690 RepID=A0A1M5A7W1_9BACT|nr:hypothetical protein [Cnuella takakiae]OLY92073.1 hypothetical protein BUE76_09330 [Cnuella takakiae]SHF25952.1 hypothetical protein SAMN05444008_106139 [Cnuella takakiae]